MQAKFTKIKDAPKPGQYKKTQVDAQKQNADIRIIYCGGGYTIATKPHVIVSGRGAKKVNEFTYQVTSSKLEKLKRQYTVAADF